MGYPPAAKAALSSLDHFGTITIQTVRQTDGQMDIIASTELCMPSYADAL